MLGRVLLVASANEHEHDWHELAVQVFDTYALMPLFAAGSPHETAAIGPEAVEAEGEEPSVEPLQARRGLREVEEPSTEVFPGAEESAISPEAAYDGPVHHRKTRRGKRAVSYIELHLLAPLSEMVVHLGNVTSWGCAASWESAQNIAHEALRLAETEGPQPLTVPLTQHATSNDTEEVDIVDAAMALHGNISDTPWVLSLIHI